MSARLHDRCAIVTGAAVGIGRAITQHFIREGARVLAVDRDAPGLGWARDDARVATLALDVAEVDAPERIVEACLRAWGQIDVLVNNAGIGGSHEALETSDEEWERVLRVNLTSAFRLARTALPLMRAQRRGRIINIVSVFGPVGFPGASSYSAAKAGLIALTRSLAADYGPDGITANAIAPGLIPTAMTRDRLQSNARYRALMLEATPLGRPGTPEDVAGAAAFLASDDAAFITGHVLVVDGGWSAVRFLPRAPA